MMTTLAATTNQMIDVVAGQTHQDEADDKPDLIGEGAIHLSQKICDRELDLTQSQTLDETGYVLRHKKPGNVHVQVF